MTGFLTAYDHQWLPCRLRVCMPLIFVGDLNGHHKEWLGSTTTNSHGRFITISNIKSIGIEFAVQYRICPGVAFGLLTILLMFIMSICHCWLDVIYQQKSSVCTTRISVGYGLYQEAHLQWIHDHSRVNREKFVCCWVTDNKTYSKAKNRFSDRNMFVLMNAQSPLKWLFILKPDVFGPSSSLPPLVGGGGGQVC